MHMKLRLHAKKLLERLKVTCDSAACFCGMLITWCACRGVEIEQCLVQQMPLEAATQPATMGLRLLPAQARGLLLTRGELRCLRLFDELKSVVMCWTSHAT